MCPFLVHLTSLLVRDCQSLNFGSNIISALVIKNRHSHILHVLTFKTARDRNARKKFFENSNPKKVFFSFLNYDPREDFIRKGGQTLKRFRKGNKLETVTKSTQMFDSRRQRTGGQEREEGKTERERERKEEKRVRKRGKKE